MNLEIIQIPAGEMDNFAYLIFCPESGEGVAVDPSFAPEAVMKAAESRGVKIETVVATHGHRDHIAGAEELCRQTGAQMAAHPADLPDADILLDEGGRLAVGRGEIEVLHTPGHTPGCIT
ncbi:MAG: MBL fold metallo-hydrolase, partial [Desulfuromonadales bacterium]|nr:MBL fold metallo-hydrolase [Desulfuromonadales bacterium]NIS43419.1 MBL fold metallo-hydrolase [Desulfuromonadales bacterium]